MENVNMFIKPILMRKRKFSIKAWIEYFKVIRLCKKCSPTFEQLYEIIEFLYILRNTYMYGNNDKFHLFIGVIDKKYNKDNSVSMVYKDGDRFSIKFILVPNNKTISIEIDRRGQTIKSEKEYISFTAGEYEFKDIYDKEKFLFIVSCVMSGVEELVRYYFRNKKF